MFEGFSFAELPPLAVRLKGFMRYARLKCFFALRAFSFAGLPPLADRFKDLRGQRLGSEFEAWADWLRIFRMESFSGMV